MTRTNRRDALILAGIGGAGFAASWLLRNNADIGRDVRGNAIAAGARDDTEAPWGGAGDGSVTIVAYTDYRCGACRFSHPEMHRAVAEDGAVRIVYKDWPILGHPSLVGAEWAIAAHFQGRYPVLHDRLMRGPIEIDESLIERAAAELGIDWARLAEDRARHNDAIVARLARHAREAFGLGLTGTPSFLIGPILVTGGLTASGFHRAFEKARA